NKLKDITIKNNIIANNFLHAIELKCWGTSIDNVKIYNNVLHGQAGAIFIQGNANVKIKNNIINVSKFARYAINNYDNAVVELSHNLYWPELKLNNAKDSNAIIANPLLSNFYPLPGSPAIDAGITLQDVKYDKAGIRRPQGKAYDIGAYEYIAELCLDGKITKPCLCEGKLRNPNEGYCCLNKFKTTSCGITIDTTPVLPEKEIHPSLLLKQEDIPKIRERIKREPYKTWWEQVKNSDNPLESAFTYLIDPSRTDKLQAAVDYIINSPFPDPNEARGSKATQYVFTYDMVQPYLTLEQDNTVRAKMAQAIESYITSKANDPLSNWYYEWSKAFSLGTATLAMSNDPRAKDWLAFMLYIIKITVESFTSADGLHSTGMNYANTWFVEGPIFDFLLAYRNCCNSDTWESFAHPFISNSLKEIMPDGHMPPKNDANVYSPLFSLFIDPKWNDALELMWVRNNIGPNSPWGWYRTTPLRRLIWWDDTLYIDLPGGQPPVPDWGSFFFKEAGVTIFRSGMDKDATYMWIGDSNPAERGIGKGTPHNQAEGYHFIIYANRHLIVPDDLWHINGPWTYTHNIIAVDGKGPEMGRGGQYVNPSKNPILHNTIDTDFADAVEYKINYAGANISRTITFPGHEYFVVYDDIKSTSTHKYDWNLYGDGTRVVDTSSEINKVTWIADENALFKPRNNSTITAYIIPKTQINPYQFTTEGLPGSLLAISATQQTDNTYY
ncbi:MAG TPA: hypothetical protein ENG42_03035, partial [Candidatus Aenigmarchaeota archaeon]|nr:hypothetical protein [Candidatus Aenigmarchaeota archaeon]